MKNYPDLIGDVYTFNDACDVIPSEQSIELYKKLIDEEYQEFIEGWSNNDRIEQLDAIADLIYVAIGFARASGFDMIGAWNEVQRSNMSKVIPETGKVLKRENGKILKPESFFSPDLTLFV